jgi:signal transduction histidine kinase
MPVYLDEMQIKTAVTSMLLNAVEATENTPNAELRLEAFLSKGKAIIRIYDNGIGLIPEHLARAFEPFFSTKGLGRGLGLTLAFGIANSHKGTLTLHPQDAGTFAELTLPSMSGRSERSGENDNLR